MHDERTEGDGPDSALVEWLASHDASCPACRYNLRGLSASRCPECGITFELGLRASMPGFGAWLIALILSCLGVGLAVLMVVGGLVELLTFGFYTTDEWLVWAACSMALIVGAVLGITLIRHRAKLWQRSSTKLDPYVAVSVVVLLTPILALAAIIWFMM